ncbi:LysE family transporter [Marinobacter nanhaiticus D15-8W]|uniref:LysE family translocator n=1 Tax=Marinobacter nanhaiticus D15-8W TaxID=626887 RepID=N6WW24_9GAMM|nr:LysE family transporter [Marinobacter nanhaiticus]ENO15766.1 LysE family translocator [Marinobacter nanhaiticus D15-8W]BES73376.1 LysE family transporter [Marinobacter nanhaiticus D15-8W]
MSSVSVELVAVATVTLLAVMSPGPDFAFVVRQCLTRGPRAGYLGAVGIGLGIAVHVSYTLLGFGLLMAQHAWLVEVIRYLGAAYLIWLGIGALLPSCQKANSSPADQPRRSSDTWLLWQGVLCNALNPKAMLFVVALFSQVVSSNTAVSVQVGYGLFIALAHVAWFSLLSRLVATQGMQRRLKSFGRLLDKVVGACLVGLGIHMVASN